MTDNHTLLMFCGNPRAWLQEFFLIALSGLSVEVPLSQNFFDFRYCQDRRTPLWLAASTTKPTHPCQTRVPKIV
jgi:hypothetical protein